MLDFFINYTEANIICIIIFGIMLTRDLFNVDKQEKQIKYDRALIAFMLYFFADIFAGAVVSGMLPKTMISVALTNFADYVCMALITYMWLRYVMAVEQVPNRDRTVNKLAVLLPFLLSTVALVVHYLVAPHTLIDSDLNMTLVLSTYLVAVPIIYIVAVLVYTFGMAKKAVNKSEKKRHLYIGMFPLVVVIGGILQVVALPQTPIFCFSCAILMLIFYIQSMEMQISIDPLTNLNNRGQLLRYTSQELGAHKDDKKTFVMMIDVNDFKTVNDTLGHAEGDRALIMIADALRGATKNLPFRTFIGRYGGDEFVLIAHPTAESELGSLIADIRVKIRELCEKSEAKYVLSVGVGYDEFLGGQDTFQKCLQRADKMLYIDKNRLKSNGETTVFK